MKHPDPDWLDSQYNNRLLVADFPEHVASWANRSASALAAPGASRDVPYGGDPTETLDIYPAQLTANVPGDGAPVVVFIHGGYWRSLDKRDFAFIGPAFARPAQGQAACTVVLNYALCPGSAAAAVTIPHISLQVAQALAWVYRNIHAYGGDASRITVIGHSAGGHLAAMAVACRWKTLAPDLPQSLVKNALAISGLYELETLRHCPYLQTDLRLTPHDAERASPAWMAAPPVKAGRGLLYAVCGGDESSEFLRHNGLIQLAWGKKAVPLSEPQAGLNHFSILGALTDPAHRLNQLVQELLRP